MLPVFIIILAAVLFAGRAWQAKQLALAQARRCAWQYSNTGCQDPPEGCEEVIGGPQGTGIDSGIEEGLDIGALDKLAGVPVIGPVIENIFGNAMLAVSKKQVSYPPLLGGRAVEINGSFYLMCNENARTVGSILRQAFCDTAGRVMGICD